MSLLVTFAYCFLSLWVAGWVSEGTSSKKWKVSRLFAVSSWLSFFSGKHLFAQLPWLFLITTPLCMTKIHCQKLSLIVFCPEAAVIVISMIVSLLVVVVSVKVFLHCIKYTNLHWRRNYDDLLSQANTWEQNGEYTRAIDFYLQLNTDNCSNEDICLKSWNKVCFAHLFIYWVVQISLPCSSGCGVVFEVYSWSFC